MHLCLAYFVVSEAEWWRTEHKEVKHPYLGTWRLGWCHLGLFSVVSGAASLILAGFLGRVWKQDMVFWGIGCLFDTQSDGVRMCAAVLLQTTVLMRPVYALSAWLSGIVLEELGGLQIGTWMVC